VAVAATTIVQLKSYTKSYTSCNNNLKFIVACKTSDDLATTLNWQSLSQLKIG